MWIRRCGQWLHVRLPWCHVTVSRWGVYTVWDRRQGENESVAFVILVSLFVALVALLAGA